MGVQNMISSWSQNHAKTQPEAPSDDKKLQPQSRFLSTESLGSSFWHAIWKTMIKSYNRTPAPDRIIIWTIRAIRIIHARLGVWGHKPIMKSVPVLVFRPFGTRPLPETKLIYWQLDLRNKTHWNFNGNRNIFLSRTLISKCRHQHVKYACHRWQRSLVAWYPTDMYQ